MHSLYNVLLAQHPKQLIPVACARSTVDQLHRYLEDVVLENKLNALVIERLPGVANRSAREIARLMSLDQISRGMFLIVRPRDGVTAAIRKERHNLKSVVWESTDSDVCERFVVIADSQFSAVLMSVRMDDAEEGLHETVVWSFDPDIVYSALEYLMARVHAEYPSQYTAFSDVVKHSMPQETSLHLTLRVTTKLVQLLQDQSRRESTVNHIATSINNGTKLELILASAVAELGAALSATCCAVRIEGNIQDQQLTQYYFGADAPLDASSRAELQTDVNACSTRLSGSTELEVLEAEETKNSIKPARVTAPITFNGIFLGVLLVRTDDPTRDWNEDHLLLLRTVAAQIAVAVKQERMANEMREQALTDGLTGCYNRRCFELQLERDLHLATRMRQPLSLVMIDIDNFKSVNETSGREAGDRALRMLAESLRVELRAVDTAARFADDQFVIILPQASSEGARVVAERLRRGIEQTEIPGFGRITGSFGVASFPLNASSGKTLVVAVDRALHHSKTSGGNLVCSPPDDYEEERIDEIPDARDLLNLHRA